MKGEVVIVRSFGGQPLIRRVWETSPETVFACSERCFQGLMEGLTELLPIGFPRYDVFEHDSDVADKLMKEWQDDPTLWEQLKVWEGEINGH